MDSACLQENKENDQVEMRVHECKNIHTLEENDVQRLAVFKAAMDRIRSQLDAEISKFSVSQDEQPHLPTLNSNSAASAKSNLNGLNIDKRYQSCSPALTPATEKTVSDIYHTPVQYQHLYSHPLHSTPYVCISPEYPNPPQNVAACSKVRRNLDPILARDHTNGSAPADLGVSGHYHYGACCNYDVPKRALSDSVICDGATANQIPHKSVHEARGMRHTFPNFETSSQRLSPNCASNSQSALQRDANSNVSKFMEDVRLKNMEKHIDSLKEEIGFLRQENKKLQQHLGKAECDLDSLKLKMQVEASLQGTCKVEAAADVIEQIYHAQKERDEAMMCRVRLANEERDDALARLQRLHDSLNSSHKESVQNINGRAKRDISTILQDVKAESSPRPISHHLVALAEQLRTSQEQRRLAEAKELKIILRERDAALIKCAQLEREVERLGHQSDESVTDRCPVCSGTLQALQDQLDKVSKERNDALAKVHDLQDEMENSALQYSLQQSLFGNEKWREQANVAVAALQSKLNQRESLANRTLEDNNQLTSALNAALSERDKALTDFKEMMQEKKNLQVACEKYKKVITVLRKRVNGLSMIE